MRKAGKGNPYERVLFVTAFSVLRQGEVLGLIWDCVDFEKGTLLINKQYNTTRGIGLRTTLAIACEIIPVVLD